MPTPVTHQPWSAPAPPSQPPRRSWRPFFLTLLCVLAVAVFGVVTMRLFPVITVGGMSPFEREAMVQLYDAVEAREPGSGADSVWDFMQSGREPWQQALAVLISHPFTYVVLAIALPVFLRVRKVI